MPGIRIRSLIMQGFAALIIGACNNASKNPDMSGHAASAPDTAETICYQRLEGTNYQDSTFIQLKFQGDTVSGTYHVIPFEKDARKGSFTGVKHNGIISGIWWFMQEGIQDSLPAQFKQTGDKLLLKMYTTDPNTGRQVLSDTAGFNIELLKINCR